MAIFTPRKLAIAIIALISLVGLPDLNSVTEKINSQITSTAEAAGSSKITICHRTHAVNNPYRMITVSNNAVNKARGHKVHTGGVFVTTSGHYLTDGGSNAKVWGDIVPGGDSDGTPYNGTNSIAQNWTTAGKTFFPGGVNASKCGKLTAKQFYDLEIAAGVSATDILDDLNDQGANEDIAVLSALGGSFTSSNIASSASTVLDTTTAATNVAHNSVTLNGQIQPGGATVQWRFQYGLNSDLSGSTTLTTLSSNVTTGQSVSANLTGLTANTTYYYEVQMVSNPGLETEGIISGGILSFKTDALLTLTAVSKSAFVGDPTPVWTYTISGLQGSDTITAVTFSFTGISPTSYSTSATAPTTASTGRYTIAITGQTFGVGSADNYSITRVNGTYTVNGAGAANQTITLPTQSNKVYGNAPYLISATTSTDTPTAIALLVDLESLTPSVCTLDTSYLSGTTSYDTITIVSAGTCTVRAIQTGGTSGGVTYASATNTGTTQSFTITPAPLTITASNKTINVGDPSPTWSYTNTALVYGETIASLVYTFTGTGSTSYGPSTSDPSTSAQATFSITPSSVTLGSSALTSNYTITYVAGTYTINATSSPAPSSPTTPVKKGPNLKLKDPTPNNSNNPNNGNTPNTPNNTTPTTSPVKKPVAPPAIPDPLPKESVQLVTNDNKEAVIEEVKSNSPVKPKVNEKGEVELIIPIGFKGEIEIEVKEKNGDQTEKIKVPVEGPKPTVEPKEQSKELPRLSPEKPGQVNVIGGDKKVTLSWTKDPEASAYNIFEQEKLVCATVYSVCTVPAENGVTKKYDVVPVSATGDAGAKISGSGRALASGTLLAIVYFNTDKFNIRPDARATLNKLVNDLYALGLRDVTLTGHTDTQAPTQYNDRLSANRSKTIEAFLGKAVIDAYLTKSSLSEKSLAVKTKDEVNQQLNRRVEIRVK